MNKIKAFFISLILICMSTVIINKYLLMEIDKYSLGVSKMYASEVKDTSPSIQNSLASKDNVFMMYGSSELGTKEIFSNPINFFPKKNAEFVASPIGRGHIQDLEHAIKFGYNNQLKNKKVLFIVSLQWFAKNGGISKERFQMNFSENEIYNLTSNPNITKKTKKQICKRVYELTEGNDKLKDTRLYTRLYSSDKLLDKIVLLTLKPYYVIKGNVLNLKSNIFSYKLVKKKSNKINSIKLKSNQEFNKQLELKKAEKIGKKLATNNDFYVEDKLYNKFIKYNKHINTVKNKNKYKNIMVDREFEDLNLLLDICEEQNIKPLFVLMPVNGRWYDKFEGIHKEKRDKFFNKVKNIIDKRGFEVKDFQQHEYDEYFMVDGKHLGWKGWIYFNEEIEKYYNKR